MKKLITIRKWKTNYPNPIKLKQNEIVEIIEKQNDNPRWKNWIFCKKKDKFGWVPKQIINKMENKKGIVIETYSAKELNVNKGEKVIGIKKLNGWFWVKREINNDQGWLPLEILEKVE